jgi:hypothetical protein
MPGFTPARTRFLRNRSQQSASCSIRPATDRAAGPMSSRRLIRWARGGQSRSRASGLFHTFVELSWPTLGVILFGSQMVRTRAKRTRLVIIMKISALISVASVALMAHAIAAAPPKGAVLTWHDDNFRTGWQQQETILTTANASKLGIAHTVALLDQVNAQPLVIPGFIGGHDIVYVVDGSNNVYQIDGTTGAIRTRVNLGTPVPQNLGCGGGPNQGIMGTPVIDWASQTLFAIAYVNVNPSQPLLRTYFLHALDLVTLKDKIPPLKVAATHPETNDAVFAFQAPYLRQKAALLFANGNVYAAFSSQCDTMPGISHGWVLGWRWNGTALNGLPANQLDNRDPNAWLSSIWMSGAGLASDETGDLFFSTGNSDNGRITVSTWSDTVPCSGTATGAVPANVGCSNVQESVVKLKGDLTTITGLFSPNAHYGTFSPNTLTMDHTDDDLGSGGVLLAPQRGTAFLAAAAGKDGRLFLLDRSSVGLKFLEMFQGAGGCWCSPSYFTGTDSIGRIVTSQGQSLQTFKIPTAGSLAPEGTSKIMFSAQDPGFFTTISCNGAGAFGHCADTPIIWAVSRPNYNTKDVYLYAFSGVVVNGAYPALVNSKAVGSWALGNNATIVPTVSNGQVYVASNKLLTILNQGGTGVLPAAAPAPTTASAFMLSGTLASVNGSTLTIKDRHGDDKLIDASKAMADGFMPPVLTTGEAYTVFASSPTSTGALLADAMYRAKCRQHNEVEFAIDHKGETCTEDQWPPDKE